MANSPHAETPLATISSSSPLAPHCPLAFPAPHRLGRGLPAHSAEQSFPRTPSSSFTATTTAARGTSSTLGIQSDNDEPDLGPLKPKRVKTTNNLQTRSTAQSKSIVITFEKKGLKKFRYFKLSTKLEVDNKSFGKLLFNSVEMQLQADVPVGVFLSGGLDSSLIAYYVSKIKKLKIFLKSRKIFWTGLKPKNRKLNS